MIDIKKINSDEPYSVFLEHYKNALSKKQPNVEAISISSYDSIEKFVDSRFVNLKYIINDEWIFFSNYNSPKAKQFYSHSQISALFFWSSINIQIRMKAKIKKTPYKFSDNYFKKRSEKKNALAISSNQSKQIDSFCQVKDNYNKSFKNNDLKKCPEYWGGYSFTPYYFEFWEGHESRINKREVFDKIEGIWHRSFLQP
jgi:pyridoxamine 5'-phosphate oxidase